MQSTSERRERDPVWRCDACGALLVAVVAPKHPEWRDPSISEEHRKWLAEMFIYIQEVAPDEDLRVLILRSLEDSGFFEKHPDEFTYRPNKKRPNRTNLVIRKEFTSGPHDGHWAAHVHTSEMLHHGIATSGDEEPTPSEGRDRAIEVYGPNFDQGPDTAPVLDF